MITIKLATEIPVSKEEASPLTHFYIRLLSKGALLAAVIILFPLGGCGSSSHVAPSSTGRIVYLGDHNGTTGIISMNPDGTGQKVLFTELIQYLTSHVSFSPDGSQILFLTRHNATPTEKSRTQIQVMNADGSNPRTLASGDVVYVFPLFSPDGSKIVFGRYKNSNNESSLCVMDANGGEPIPITQGRYEYYASFSPDGSKILFSSYADSNSDIRIINVDGTAETILATNASMPSFSPDGSRFVFCRPAQNGFYDIFVMNTDGTGEQQITTNSDEDSTPSFSPDGTKIVFNSTRASSPWASSSRIYVMNADGTDQKPITEIPSASKGSDTVFRNAWALTPVP